MKDYKATIRKRLSSCVETLRKVRKLTQEQMAEELRITPRSYSNLKSGKFCFSILPLLFLILMLDVNELILFQTELRESMASVENAYAS